MDPTAIRIAHSRQKTGFTVFSFAFVPSERHGILRERITIAIEETLEEARERVLIETRRKWTSLGLPVPPISIVGRVSDAMGRAGHF